MANIITNADVKKFLTLLQVGLAKGTGKELKSYEHSTNYDGTQTPKHYFVSLEFRFTIDASELDKVFEEDSFDITNQVNNLMKGL